MKQTFCVNFTTAVFAAVAVNGNCKVRNYLSSHPDTGDRIQRILKAGE